MKRDLQDQSEFRSSWKTIISLFLSLYTRGRKKGYTKQVWSTWWQISELNHGVNAPMLCLQGKNVLCSWVTCQKTSKILIWMLGSLLYRLKLMMIQLCRKNEMSKMTKLRYTFFSYHVLIIILISIREIYWSESGNS